MCLKDDGMEVAPSEANRVTEQIERLSIFHRRKWIHPEIYDSIDSQRTSITHHENFSLRVNIAVDQESKTNCLTSSPRKQNVAAYGRAIENGHIRISSLAQGVQ